MVTEESSGRIATSAPLGQDLGQGLRDGLSTIGLLRRPGLHEPDCDYGHGGSEMPTPTGRWVPER